MSISQHHLLKFPYSSDVIPAPLLDLAAAPSIQRLLDVGMNCGCEYTSFPVFNRPESYHRYEHSLGVAMIIWHFTGDLKQAVAGLLHDIATPVFAHVIDFVRGDYLKQEATEAGTREIIESDECILAVLKRCRLSIEEVCDYHIYPIADNDSPRLSADRLEYTIGNILHYGFASSDTVERIYKDLIILRAEDDKPEIGFQHEEIALLFSKLALYCSRLYVSPEDRYAMQRLSEIVHVALKSGVLVPKMLYTTEKRIIGILSTHNNTRMLWDDFIKLHSVIVSDDVNTIRNPRRIPAKKRCIDPYVIGCGRVSNIFPEFLFQLNQFLEESQTRWIGEPL